MINTRTDERETEPQAEGARNGGHRETRQEDESAKLGTGGASRQGKETVHRAAPAELGTHRPRAQDKRSRRRKGNRATSRGVVTEERVKRTSRPSWAQVVPAGSEKRQCTERPRLS